MRKLMNIIWAGMFVLAGSLWAEEVTELHNLGYVVVSPNGPTDGGDYGPHTPGTQTSGLQEAFDFAKDNVREVYVIGGSVTSADSPPVVYNLETTLHIPWGQDWNCEGGNYIMNFTQTSGDCLWVDCQMTCDLKFGSVHAPNIESGALVKLKPETPGPDTFIAFGARRVRLGSIIAGPKGKDKPGRVVGLHIDASFGAICAPYISTAQIKNCDVGILMDPAQGGQGILDCVIESPIIKNCDTSIKVNTGYYNRIIAAMDADAGSALGADLSGGYENNYTLTWLSDFPAGKALVLGPGARDNLIYAMNLPDGGITNNATRATNRIIPLKPVGFKATTPAIPPTGSALENRQPYPMWVTILTPGEAIRWTVTDSNGQSNTVSSKLLAGQAFYLEPGDKITLHYSQAPTWKWKALR